MYRIYAKDFNNDILIYNDSTPDLTTTKLISPSLSLKDNAAGSFNATVPIGNAGYDMIKPFDTTIDIYRRNQDGSEDWIWRGRILSIAKDFWKQKKIVCEGALAFLNDTVVPLAKLERYSIAEYVGYLLSMHNSKVPSNRRIYPGVISNTGSANTPIGFNDYIVDGDNVLSYISTVVEDWGLHARIRVSGYSLYLDLLPDSSLVMSSQSINFGKNLLDYTDNFDWSDIITAILPLGGKLDTNDTTGDEEYPDRLTIEGKHSSSSGLSVDGMYLVNDSAAYEHGRIEQTVEWSDIDDADELLSLAELYLNDYQYNTLTLTVKVFDLHYLLDSDVEAFDFLSQINCYSKPHGLNSTFIVTEMTIPFDTPENTVFTMTKQTMGTYGADKGVSSVGGKISASASNIPVREGVLKTARENAAAMVNMATNGYVTLVPTDKGDRVYALTITNNIDEESSTQMWKWTLGGLMFQNRSSIGSSWNSPTVAMTMDGQIVATMITTGILTVDDGQGGILFQADFTRGSRSVSIAGFEVTDEAIYNTKDTLDDDYSAGVYLGNDGVAIGDANSGLFKVDVNNGTALISGFHFDNEKLWTQNRTDTYSNDSGVYIADDGFSTGDGTFYMTLGDGYLYGGENSYNQNYLFFKNNAILASPNTVGILGDLAVGDYADIDEGATMYTGQTFNADRLIYTTGWHLTYEKPIYKVRAIDHDHIELKRVITGARVRESGENAGKLYQWSIDDVDLYIPTEFEVYQDGSTTANCGNQGLVNLDFKHGVLTGYYDHESN